MSGMTAAVCGTVAGYQAHRRHKEPVCDACRSAYAAYWRDYRRDGNRGYVRGKARSRAMNRLAQQHPKAFAALLAEELAAVECAVATSEEQP